MKVTPMADWTLSNDLSNINHTEASFHVSCLGTRNPIKQYPPGLALYKFNLNSILLSHFPEQISHSLPLFQGKIENSAKSENDISIKSPSSVQMILN